MADDLSLQAQEAIKSIYAEFFLTGSGQPYAVTEACSPDGETVFFIGLRCDALFEAPVAAVYVRRGAADPVEHHAGPAQLLELSPCGRTLAFCVEGGRSVVLTDLEGHTRLDAAGDGRIEQLAWSPDGKRLLLLVAGAGTDTSTLAGSIRGRSNLETGLPSWSPDRDTGAVDADNWRQLVIVDALDGTKTIVPTGSGMIWEACWCGPSRLAFLQSQLSGETGWYRPEIGVLDLASSEAALLYRPAAQVGRLRGSPDGRRVAFVEGPASDRGLVCGKLQLLDLGSGEVRPLDTGAVDIASIEWRDLETLHIAGLRGLESVISDLHIDSGVLDTLWSSTLRSCGGLLPASRPVGERRAVTVVESYTERPWPIVLDGPSDDAPELGDQASPLRWTAPDGLQIEGLLIRPTGVQGPLPLVVDIHGGPIWAYKAAWAARLRAAPALVARGFAVLLPNPRGSCGRGQAFAGAVIGDMGGADVDDLLAGVDYLVAQGIVDQKRVGLTGSSYGGYMSAWVSKRRPEIAAIAAISPVSNWFSQHWTSNMPALEDIFIGGSPGEMAAAYLAISPALSPVKTQAACLILAGALDRCTPVGQAIELHRALLHQGARSVLLTYPQEGHSLRGPRGYLDSAGEVLAWFETHLAPRGL